jgi:hypothetical protein
VITHDDGQIYTVKPNTEQTARDEAWMADGTPILIRFLDDPNPRIVADYPALSVTTQESE